MSTQDLRGEVSGEVPTANELGLHASLARTPSKDVPLDAPTPTLLSISVPSGSSGAFTIYVSVNGTVASFNTSAAASTFTDGVVFVFNSGAPSSISTTWVLPDDYDLTSESSPLVFSGLDDNKQTAALALSTQGAWFGDFLVQDTLRTVKIDPQIIVTPIGGGK